MTSLSNLGHHKILLAIGNLSESLLSKNLSDTDKKPYRKNTQAHIPDEQLVSASQQGDTKAFEILVLRYQRQIFNLIYQMTHDVEVVEDIGQDVFIAAFKAIKDFKAKSSFFTWLYRIAINHCKNYLASSNRAQDAEKRYHNEQGTGDISELKERDPQNILLAKEFVEKMEEALASLPEEQQFVLTLCEFQGLSYQEIAEVLECPIGTVRSRLSRARAALQDNLGEYL